ncbi:High-affinity branched-chain amino acid transport system permease protein LivH [wastewater metagenome]|uniref:High-affinity branched-chain amino acid transport system permease protein LivH n=2 Tax=unclassified sequences TaxID=12908 RepID=A0A5B8RAM1_9ZZZZ|nr:MULTISPECIES: branched-chain amino acid ABC transporter permease [Arhodomonas]MCS4505700.1 branched-chain amino acid ABC transporter permease [Arhodomonas aquaeolei]QEA05820.1 high-affinity branched-chain amino acid transport system permease protein LivH [uncultured organism]
MSGDLINALFLQILTGLQLGMIYAMIALGLTLIFGTLGVVNFAHGALYLIGAYCAVIIAGKLGFLYAVILVPLILFVIGIILERGLIQYFYDRPHTDQILVTFGLAIVAEEALKWIFGANNIPYPVPSWGQGIVMLHEYVPFLSGFVVFPKWRLILILVSLVVIGALFFLLQFTRFGLVIRSGMRDAEMVRFLGINITRRFAAVFGLGALIAGIAGVFGGPITQVSPAVGMKMLVPSFLVVVIGGMGSVAGALIAAVVLGMALSFTAEYSSIQQIIIYLVAVVVLLTRPRGLMGKKGVFE